MHKQGISNKKHSFKAREKSLAKCTDQKSTEESFQVVATEENKSEDRSKQKDMAKDEAEGKDDFFTNFGSKLEQLDNNIKLLNTTMDTRMKNINRSIEDRMGGIRKENRKI